MANLLDRSSLVLTPTAYNNGEALCIKPDDASGDFQFSRNSAATRVNAQGLVENVQILSSNLVQNGSFSEEGVQEVSNGSFSQEGVQQVTNGDFATDSDWVKIGNTSIDTENQVGVFNGVASGSGGFLQNNVFTAGKFYKVSFEIIQIDEGSGGVRLDAGGIGTVIPPTTSLGVVSQVFEYTSSGANDRIYVLAGSGVVNCQIDNISVREVGQDWTLGTGWSIGEDKAIATSTANSISIYQNNTVEVGKTYKVTYTVADYVEGGIYVRVGSGVNGVVRFGNGTYTEYITQAGDNKLYLTTYTTTTLSITNISVKEVGQNWDFDANWSIGNNKAISTGAGRMFQSIPFLETNVGIKVKVSFDIVDYTSAGVVINCYGGVSSLFQGVGSYSFITTTTNTLNLYVNNAGAGNLVGSITNLSVIAITEDTNLPRINYEGFSYQDVLGSELSSPLDFLNKWFGAGATSITNNSFEVNGSGQGMYFALGIDKEYKIKVSNVVGDVNVRYRNGLSGAGTVVGNFDEFIIINTFGSTNPNIYLRANSATSITVGDVSVKEYLGQEVVPDSGCGSWLFEPQSTNLIEYSNDYADAYWTVKANSSINSNAIISPDGNLNADKLVENTSSSTHYINKNSFVLISGVDYTYSVFAKAGERSNFWLRTINGVGDAYFDLSNGTITSGVGGFIEDYGNGWYRCSVSGTSTSTTGNPYIYLVKSGTTTNYLGDGTSGLYIYGFQVEQKSYATSYIPTSGSTVTRNQDVCNNGGSSASINNTEGTLYFEGAALANDGTFRQISLTQTAGGGDVITLDYSSSSNGIRSYLRVGAVSQSLTYILSDETQYNKIAVRYKDTHSIWVNGLEVASQALTTLPINLNVLTFDNGSGGGNLYGKTKAVAVWKEALSDQELSELTTI